MNISNYFLPVGLVVLLSSCVPADVKIANTIIADGALYRDPFLVRETDDGKISARLYDGGENDLERRSTQNGVYDYGDSIEFVFTRHSPLSDDNTSCYFVSGYGFIELTVRDDVTAFGKYDQAKPALQTCYDLASNLVDHL